MKSFKSFFLTFAKLLKVFFFLNFSKVLKVFESNKINLSHIQSRPNKSDKWQYSFFLDFEGHVEDTKVKNLLKKLSSVTQTLKILGSYPKSI